MGSYGMLWFLSDLSADFCENESCKPRSRRAFVGLLNGVCD